MNDRNRPPMPSSPAELEQLRQWLEGMDTIDVVTPEMRELIERHWPHMAAKLPPRD